VAPATGQVTVVQVCQPPVPGTVQVPTTVPLALPRRSSIRPPAAAEPGETPAEPEGPDAEASLEDIDRAAAASQDDFIVATKDDPDAFRGWSGQAETSGVVDEYAAPNPETVYEPEKGETPVVTPEAEATGAESSEDTSEPQP